MLRVITCLLALFMLEQECWAQGTATPAPPSFAGKHIFPIRNGLPAAAPSAVASTAVPADNGIQYYGGPILDDANGVNVYYIWYGDWSKDRDAQKILVNLIKNIGGSPYFNTNTSYYSFEVGPHGTNLVKDRVINAVHYMGSVTDHYSLGADLSDELVDAAVANAITSGALPADPNGVYFLLTSADVTESSGFGIDYCGWHFSRAAGGLPLVDGVDVKDAFVGNAETQAAYACIWNDKWPMTSSLGADGMANVIAHELEEMVTDPDVDSWYDINGLENADKCAWTFGGKDSTAYPHPPNMKFNGISYLIQQNWVNAKGGYCAMKWDD